MKGASNGQLSGTVLFDLSSAFDLLPVDILIKKAAIYGLDKSFQQWLRSYLSGRFQSVWIDHCFSPLLPCELGVPQGSILGPLVFLLFINDLSFSLDCDSQQYADDTTLSATGDCVEDISAKLTSNCSKLSNWMSSNRFKLNADKTHVMTLGTEKRLKNNHKITVEMDNLELRESPEGKETLLGIGFSK